jgi:acyl carrier protein
MTHPSEDNPDIEGTVAAEVCRIVAETQELDVAAVQPELELEADLGVDSLAMIAITVAVEESFDIRAPDVDQIEASAIVTVRDLIELVDAELARQAEVPG